MGRCRRSLLAWGHIRIGRADDRRNETSLWRCRDIHYPQEERVGTRLHLSVLVGSVTQPGDEDTDGEEDSASSSNSSATVLQGDGLNG